jgi:anti-anti-sigma regulatory factor
LVLFASVDFIDSAGGRVLMLIESAAGDLLEIDEVF